MHVAKLHYRIGNLHCEFLQKKTTTTVESHAVIATKNCGRRNMSCSAKGTHDKSGRMVRQGEGLDREVLSAGLCMAQNKLARNAVEAGT